MKNRAGFYISSYAFNEAVDEGKEYISFKCPEEVARGSGIEWHHSGSGSIAFFYKNEKEYQEVLKIREKLKNRKIKSKKAAIEYLELNCNDEKEDYLEIPFKEGKYGKFFNFFGKKDGSFYLSRKDENFTDIRDLVKV